MILKYCRPLLFASCKGFKIAVLDCFKKKFVYFLIIFLQINILNKLDGSESNKLFFLNESQFYEILEGSFINDVVKKRVLRIR